MTIRPGFAGHGSHRPGAVCFECDRLSEHPMTHPDPTRETEAVLNRIEARTSQPNQRLPSETLAKMDPMDREYSRGWYDGIDHERERLAALPTTTPAPSLDQYERLKRLQSAHHRTIRVTAVTCSDCKRERTR